MDALLEELAPVAVIKKPFDVEEVLEVVRSYCAPGQTLDSILLAAPSI